MTETELAAIRFGYGLGPNRRAADAAALLRGLAAPDDGPGRHPMMDVKTASALEARFRAAQRAARDGGADAEEALKAVRAEMSGAGREALRLSMARCLDAESALRERLVMFWADHFTARPKANVLAAYVQPYLDATIRPHVTGRFADMLKAVVESPLMLAYLDQTGSIGPNSQIGRKRGKGLNENLAREMLELHTLGVGGAYGQADVRELAELLTGLDWRATEGFAFRRAMAEPGAETVLGKSYGGDPAELEAIHAALEDLAVHPDTARHMARKLAVHFVADTPPEALVEALEAAWRDNGGDLMAVYGVLLSHPEAWRPELGKVKPPFGFVVSALVALGMRGADLLALERRVFHRLLDNPMRTMGQRFFSPPGPDGWPETAQAWVTPQGVASRIRWSLDAPRRLVDPLPDPRGFVQVALGGLAPQRLVGAVNGAESRVQGLALVLASPAFNRR